MLFSSGDKLFISCEMSQPETNRLALHQAFDDVYQYSSMHFAVFCHFAAKHIYLTFFNPYFFQLMSTKRYFYIDTLTSFKILIKVREKVAR